MAAAEKRVVREKASPEVWRERIERWKSSGLKAKEFAAAENLSERSLSWWQWQLQRRATPPAAAAEKPARKKRSERVDHTIAKLPPSRRTDERRRLAVPILEAFKVWLDGEDLVVLPQSPIAEAIGYVRNQWGALTRFLDDARLKLDNNTAERQLRRVAIGRKNWLFAGSEAGAERACVIYSLLASCKLNGVNAFDYLRDVLVRVGSHPARDVLALSPKTWKKNLQNVDAAQATSAA